MRLSLFSLLHNFFILLILVFYSGVPNYAQTSKIEVSCFYGKEWLELDKSYYSDVLRDSIRFSTIKFLLLNIAFKDHSGKRHPVAKKYHLVDRRDPQILFTTIRQSLALQSVSIDLY